MRVSTLLGAVALAAAVNGYPMVPAADVSGSHLEARQIPQLDNLSNIVQGITGGITGFINAFKTIGSAFGGIGGVPQQPTAPQAPQSPQAPQTPQQPALPQQPVGAPQLPPQTFPVVNQPTTGNTGPIGIQGPRI
ncbi:hypothetical protein TWF281_007796 [Arthrobotrys megalospora]